MMYQKKSRACQRGFQNHNNSNSSGKSTNVTIPRNWRDRLPKPSDYYASHVSNLSEPSLLGWASAMCPFCKKAGALGVDTFGNRGSWRCSGNCGGGDLVGFHMRYRGIDFKEAVRELITMSKPSTRQQIASMKALYQGVNHDRA